jgi:hypothetical protein
LFEENEDVALLSDVFNFIHNCSIPSSSFIGDDLVNLIYSFPSSSSCCAAYHPFLLSSSSSGIIELIRFDLFLPSTRLVFEVYILLSNMISAGQIMIEIGKKHLVL